MVSALVLVWALGSESESEWVSELASEMELESESESELVSESEWARARAWVMASVSAVGCTQARPRPWSGSNG